MSLLIWQPEPVTSDLDRMAHYAGLWGVDGIELRTVGKHKERVPWVNEAPIKHRVDAGELSIAVCDPGMLTCDVADKSAWLNDTMQFPDVVAFNRRLGIPTTLLGALSGSEHLPVDPYLRMCTLARAAGQTVLVADDGDERVGLLLDELEGYPVRRAISVGLNNPSVSGDPGTIGLLRLVAVPVSDVDQATIERDWTGFLRGLQDAGFSGDITIEFGSGEAGKIGLRLFTSLIRAMRAARPPRPPF